MKRVGYSAVKAGAIEAAAGVNGQLMPPVMGAAAFLIAEYVGITYADVVKHAFLPAFLTYGALFYIVDIEAAKLGLKGLPRTSTLPIRLSLLRALMTICGVIILSGIVYYGIGWIKIVFGDAAALILGILLLAAYIALVRYKAEHKDLALDDISKAIIKVPDFFATARTGLHFLLPVIVLIWCLMVEELSPGLSAFWGTLFLHLHHAHATAAGGGVSWRARVHGAVARRIWRPHFRFASSRAQHDLSRHRNSMRRHHRRHGFVDRHRPSDDGNRRDRIRRQPHDYAAPDSPGLPDPRHRHADDGKLYRGGALLWRRSWSRSPNRTTLRCHLLPCISSYFIFGLMADVHPPAGLAAYAAAAISGADPIKTGLQGFWYEIRTGLLPFIFIFNSELLLIDVGGVGHFLIVVVCSIIAMGCFRRGHAELAADAQPLVRDGGAVADLFHAVRPATGLTSCRRHSKRGRRRT